jgi:Helicase associated domain
MKHNCNEYYGEGRNMCFNSYNDFCVTKLFPAHPESLFSMASASFTSAANRLNHDLSCQAPTPFFYPLDERKDFRLGEILYATDDCLREDDPLMTASVYPTDIQPPSTYSPENPGSPDEFFYREDDNLMNAINVNLQDANADVVGSLSISSCTQILDSHSDLAVENARQVSDQKSTESSGPVHRVHTKKRKFCDPDVSSDYRPFRPYQVDQWTEKFQELCDYRQNVGHCLVPHSYNDNLPLARWVKRQRYQYKLMIEGKPSSMTEDRVNALENIGFVWDSQNASWEERLGELREFCAVFQHCNVPSSYGENPQLATWIKCQRRQYKLYVEGKPSNITKQRIEKLESLGFEWELRSIKKVKQSNKA